MLLSVAFLSFLVPVSGKNGAGVYLSCHLVLGVRKEKPYVNLRFWEHNQSLWESQILGEQPETKVGKGSSQGWDVIDQQCTRREESNHHPLVTPHTSLHGLRSSVSLVENWLKHGKVMKGSTSLTGSVRLQMGKLKWCKLQCWKLQLPGGNSLQKS